MQKSYVVSVLGIWEEKIFVVAESKEEALSKVERGERGETISLTLLHDYDEEWQVEESPNSS